MYLCITDTHIYTPCILPVTVVYCRLPNAYCKLAAGASSAAGKDIQVALSRLLFARPIAIDNSNS